MEEKEGGRGLAGLPTKNTDVAVAVARALPGARR